MGVSDSDTEPKSKKYRFPDPISTTEEELKFRLKTYPDVSVIENTRLQCTVCSANIKVEVVQKMRVHSHMYLKVLLCKSCFDFYGSGEFSIDEDGLDKYCRWCGQGGKLYICNDCPSAFCKKCIKQNLPRSVQLDIKKDDWKCFLCCPKPLFEHRALCWAVEHHISNSKKNVEMVKKKAKDNVEGKLENGVGGIRNHRNIKQKEFLKFCSELKYNSTKINKLVERNAQKVREINLRKSNDIYIAHENIFNAVNEFQKILIKLHNGLNSNMEYWEQERAIDLNSSDNCEVTIDEEPIIVNSESDGNKSENDCNGAAESAEKEECVEENDKCQEEVVAENIKEEEKDDSEGKNSSDDKSDSSKPLLRVRNIEELNKVISEDTKGEIFDISSGKQSDSETNDNTMESIPSPARDKNSKSVEENSSEPGTTKSLEGKKVAKCKELDSPKNVTQEDGELPSEEISEIRSEEISEITSEEISEIHSEDISVSNIKSKSGTESESNKSAKCKGEKKKKPHKDRKKSHSRDEKITSDASGSRKEDEIKVEKENTEEGQAVAVNDSAEGNNLRSSVESTHSNSNVKKSEETKVNGSLPGTNDEPINISSGTSSYGFSSSDSESVELPKRKTRNCKKSPIKINLRSSKKEICTSDSDGEIKKLLDSKTLKKRKRINRSESLDSSSSNTNKEEKQKTPKKKKVTESGHSSELDFDESKEDSDSSLDINEIVMNFSSLKEGTSDYASISQTLLSTKTDSDTNDESIDDLFSDEDKKKKKKTKEKESKGNSDCENKKGSDSDKSTNNKKTRSQWRRDKLLREKLSDTDMSEEERKWKKKKETMHNSDSSEDMKKWMENKRKKKIPPRNMRKRMLTSDSSSISSEPENEDESSDSESEKEETKKKKRKRIQRVSTDSDSDENSKCPDSGGKGRKNIRKVLKEESLEKSTQEALKEEQERKKRISERQKLYYKLVESSAKTEGLTVDNLVLDFDADEKKEIVSVDKDLVKKMKPHQAEGVKFMWDACYESLKLAKKDKGSGCILAHCMGLGKSFQVVTLVHTLLTHKEIGVRTVLVVCPLSTVPNWANEFEKWLKDIGSGDDIDIFTLQKAAMSHRSFLLKDWHRQGGVMIMGYNMFRSLSCQPKKTRPSVKKAFEETLVDPGPDLVICDEGHILKNESTALSNAMSKIKTLRRVVLTGTPLQNNLVEYHCMVQFVKPNLLGTKKEFKNRFVNPIVNGQFEDSTAHDVKVMKRRAHVLHKLLDGIVQRKDYNVLTPYLPQKFEYVINLALSDVQTKLYQHYLDHLSRGGEVRKGATLFRDWQCLSRICTHPRVLLMHSNKEISKKLVESDEDSAGSLKNFIHDDSKSEDSTSTESSSSDSSVQEISNEENPKNVPSRRTRANPKIEESEPEIEKVERSEWWSNIVSEEQLEVIKEGPKIVLLFTILKKCEEIGDKLLVFSQSLITLDLIEHFLDRVSCTTEDEIKQMMDENPEGTSLIDYSATWDKGIDYFRLDGQTASELRTSFISQFNNEKNNRARLFLISTRAGGLGINLVGANRVIIFDASWNPSDDVQSIFRVFRFGQKKPCYIYRFLAQGTMEEKIYERQVAKLSISCRVVDEQQVDRHFSHSDLAELYSFNPEKQALKATPILPKDRLMAELLQLHGDIICTHHQHDSLLENLESEELNEEERQQAWQDFENEKNAPPAPEYNNSFDALTTIVGRLKIQNPTWPEEMLQQTAKEILLRYQSALIRNNTGMMFQMAQTSNMNQQQPIQQQTIQPQPQPRYTYTPRPRYILPNPMINQNQGRVMHPGRLTTQDTTGKVPVAYPRMKEKDMVPNLNLVVNPKSLKMLQSKAVPTAGTSSQGIQNEQSDKRIPEVHIVEP